MDDAVSVEENEAKIRVPKDSAHPSISVPFFNPQMRNNRFLVLLALRTLTKEKEGRVECLDAFSSSGVMGIQWKLHLKERVAVVLSEVSNTACAWIERNARGNGLELVTGRSSDLSDDRPLPAPSLLLPEDCGLVLLTKSFDFVHLDPFGSACPHLELAFRKLRHRGILTITSTDVASLFARNPQVVRRNYGVAVVKTEYVKEMAVRIVVGAAVRAGARFGKAVEVLFAVSSDHFLLVCLRVTRGAASIDASLAQLAPLLHCRLCEERCFLPDQLAPLENPYDFLPCDCRSGRSAVVLGPMWKGPLFCPDFVSRLRLEASQLEVPPSLRSTLRLIGEEAGLDGGTDTNGREAEPVVKRPRGEAEGHAPFYFFPARMKLSNVDIPKLDDLVAALRARGIRSSRTHFEPTALRAACSLTTIKEAILALQTS